MPYRELQKMLYLLDNLEYQVNSLKKIHESPCIVVTGVRNLHIYKNIPPQCKKITLTSLINELFIKLKVPTDYILFVGHPPRVTNNNKNTIPFTAYIFLTTESIKLYVHRLLLGHIKKTKQKDVHIKILN